MTSSRMPTALDQIRKLGRRGHEVFAADTFGAAPGGHSRYARASRIVASPRFASQRFVEDVADVVRTEGIEWVLPAFEEAYCLAERRHELPSSAKLFCPPFATLLELHDKAQFLLMARSLGLRTPAEVIVTSRVEFDAAIREFARYVAKPALGHGGVGLVTNVPSFGNGRGAEHCEPTPERRWVVQEFVAGLDVCTFSIARMGRITAHTTYVHPREIEHAGGIVFESVDDPEAMDIARRIVEHTRYDGQISLDFRRDPRGLVLLECNPRPTAGAHLMSDETFEDALLGSAARVHVTPAGVRRKYSTALVRDMALHWSESWEDARHLFSSAEEVVLVWDDPLPALYQVLSYQLVVEYRKRMGSRRRLPTDLTAGFLDDLSWDGVWRPRVA